MRLNSLTASFSGFRSISFNDGLNIVVADRAKEATKTDSRNGLGKTTVIALIDYCLGANMSDRLEQMKGNNWYFTLSLTTRAGVTVLASRSPDTSGEIHLEGGVVAAGIVEPKDLADDGTATVGTRKWTNWLGRECFVRDGMPADPPTFRSLIRHFARFRADSLLGPFSTLANQAAEAVQAENAYLLNLDWRFAKEWAKLRDRKARVALADDPDNSIESRIAALEPQLVRLQRRTERLTKDISTFSAWIRRC